MVTTCNYLRLFGNESTVTRLGVQGASAATDAVVNSRASISPISLEGRPVSTSLASLEDDAVTNLTSLAHQRRAKLLDRGALHARHLSEDELVQVLDGAVEGLTLEDLALKTNGHRRYVRLFRSRTAEAWLIEWASSTYLGLHDHGGSRAAYEVISGTLTEATTVLSSRAPLTTRRLEQGDRRTLGPRHVHELWNSTSQAAISLHVYSPPLRAMSYYSDHPSSYLSKIRTETALEWPNPERWAERAVG